MHYGNQNTKRFLLVMILVLFVGGFVKGMNNASKKQTIHTVHLSLQIPSSWELGSYDAEKDSIILNDAQGTATIQMEKAEIVNDGEILQEEKIGKYAVSGYHIQDEKNHLYLTLQDGDTTIFLHYESKKKVEVEYLKKLILQLKINKE